MSKKNDTGSDPKNNVQEPVMDDFQKMQLKAGSGPDFSRIIAAVILCGVLFLLAKIFGL